MHENPIPTPPAPAPMRRYAEVTEEVRAQTAPD